MNMVKNKIKENFGKWHDIGYDGDTYENFKNQLDKERRSIYYNEYCRFIEDCGFKLSTSCTDFFSDGLRFATSTDFS